MDRMSDEPGAGPEEVWPVTEGPCGGGPGVWRELEIARHVPRVRGTRAMVRDALRRGDAVLAYQPVMRADGAGVAFHEGLIRLMDETGLLIPAGAFIHVIEEDELGREVDCVALRLGLEALRRHPEVTLSINMSARSVGHAAWMRVLERGLAQRPDIARRLILEITETSTLQMPEDVAIFMGELQDRGISFALDDFGAGCTAFRHLRDLRFDIVKIDGQFARQVDADPDNRVLYEALIGLARHFDMLVVAEAVETAGEAGWLRAAGVDCLQGYHFGAPSIAPPWRAATGGAPQGG